MMLVSPLRPPHRHPWRYWRLDERPDIREMSFGRGTSIALPTHFHTEDQISLVLAGCRHFSFSHHCVAVPAGHALRIPAGLPHASRDSGAETVCVNLYSAADTFHDPADIAAALEELVNEGPVSVIPLPFLPALNPLNALITGATSIQALAHEHHMTREGYSRRFRRDYGVSPQNMQLLGKLNTAKTLLRDQHTLAETAMQAGFSDQSHLTRLFRRAFGTTPGRYRHGA